MALKIIPTILTDKLSIFVEQVEWTRARTEEVPIVQVDIIDGEFAPSLTLFPDDLAGIDFGELKIDWHLMAIEPLDYAWDIFNLENLPTRSLIAQIERMSDPRGFIEAVTSHNFKAGICLDLYTPVEEIESSWFEQGLKIIQLMTVKAGAQGQAFSPLVFEKLAELKKTYGQQIETYGVEIMIDGGVNQQTLAELLERTPLRIDATGVGSALWRGDLAENLAGLLAVVEGD